jgi:hypothetical protein
MLAERGLERDGHRHWVLDEDLSSPGCKGSRLLVLRRLV